MAKVKATLRITNSVVDFGNQVLNVAITTYGQSATQAVSTSLVVAVPLGINHNQADSIIRDAAAADLALVGAVVDSKDIYVPFD